VVAAGTGRMHLETVDWRLGDPVWMAPEFTWREPALVTFLVTLSGLSMAGIGSAFWGVVAGTLCVAVMRLRAG